MAKEKITNHGLYQDTTNYDALGKALTSVPSFLDSPKPYEPKANKNYGTKPKTKKLVLSNKQPKKDDK